MSANLQMCMANDLIPDEPCCRRLAQWSWQPDPDKHPVFLCNFHALDLEYPSGLLARVREAAQ